MGGHGGSSRWGLVGHDVEVVALQPFGLSEVKRDAEGRACRDLVPVEAEAIRQATRDILEGRPR
jgi:hypothetical protein